MPLMQNDAAARLAMRTRTVPFSLNADVVERQSMAASRLPNACASPRACCL
jgi:hypothetical protein